MKLIEEMLGDVQRFTREITGASIAASPALLSESRYEDKLEHLKEELAEFETANSWPEQADALIDLIYVALGGLVEMGISPGSAFNEVHNANMEKVSGTKDERPGQEFDAVKPEDWNPPQLTAAIIPQLASTEPAAERLLTDCRENTS